MAGEFRREYLLRLPLPLAQLYGRSHNAPAARARHDNTFYLFEALIKLAACPLIASYLRQIEHGERRSPAIDRLLAQLALPSLGQWVAILRGLSRHFGQRPDSATHPLGHLWQQLDTPRRDCPGILALYRRIKNGPDGEPGGDQNCSLMEVIDALVLYRNTVFGHGAGRCDSFYEQEMGPLLAPAASEILAEGIFDLLGPRGTRLVYINELRVRDDRQMEASLSDLVGLEAERMSPLTLSAADNADLTPNCIAVLWPGQKALLPLDPLLVFRGSAVTDEVLFLNRDRNGRQVEYLSYTTGQIERDKSLAPAMARLLARICGREVQEEELAELARQSTSETASVEALFEPTSRRRTLGDYEILAEIGRGGMGVVYLARQLSLGRIVALKMLPADIAGDESALARFRREMRALGRCEHPNIVKVLASGTLPDGQLYYAMEYIPGADLEMVWRELSGSYAVGSGSTLGGTTWGRAVLSASQKQRDQAERRASGEPTVSGVIASADTQVADSPRFAAPDPSAIRQETPEPLPLPPLPSLPEFEDDPRGFFRRVAALVRDAAAAVQAVHDQNIIHRDIKPANLLLTPDGSRIVLMDFGLAKGQGLTRSASRTAGFLGTLRYAAPEQLAAAKVHVGPQADVRALGVTLWELLSRRRLFDEAEDENQMASWVLTRDVPPLRKVDNSIDPDLEAIVARATEREVERRIQTARELMDYLQMYLDGKPLPIRRPGTAEVLGRWVREHKALVGTASAAVISILVVGVVAFLFVVGAWKREQIVNSQLTSTNTELENSKKTLLKTNTSLETALKEVAEANRGKDQALANEKQARLDAQHNEQEARISQKRAEAREAEARQSLYASRMLMAHQSLQADELARAIEQLDVQNWASDSRQLSNQRRWEGWTPGEIANNYQKNSALRGWEWWYLDGLTRARTSNLRGHKATSYCVGWSPDGKWIASGDRDGKVLLFDAVTHQVSKAWTGRRSWSLDVSLEFRDNKLLIARIHSFAKDKDNLPPVGSYIVAFADPTGRLIEVDSLAKEEIADLHRKSVGTPWTVQVVHPDGGPRRTYTLPWHSFPPLEHSDRVVAVVFSHDSRKLATVSWDDSVVVWNLDDLLVPQRFTGFGNGAYDAAFSPDDTTLAVAASDEKIHVLNLQRRTRNVLSGHTGIVRGVAFSPDGKQLASGGVDGTLRLWNAQTWQQEKILAQRRDTVMRVCYSPDGKLLVELSQTAKMTAWQMPEEKVVYNGSPGNHGGGCLAFNRLGDKAVCGILDGNVSLISREENVLTEAQIFHTHSAIVWGVALSPDGRHLASCASDGTLRVSDLSLDGASEQQLCRKFETGVSNVVNLTSTLDGRGWILGSRFRLAHCDAATGRRLPGPGGQIDEFTGFMRGTAVSADGRYVAFGTRDGGLRVVLREGGRPIRTFPTDPNLRHQATIDLVAFSPNGRLLASADRGRNVSVWNLATGRRLCDLQCDGGTTRNVLTFSPDSRWLLTGFGSNKLQLWDIGTSELLTELEEDRPYRAVFDPTGGRLYTGSFHSVITVWDMTNYQPLMRLRGHRGPVTALALSSDGRRLASAAGDGLIFLWEPQLGQQLMQLGRLDGLVGALCFRADGQALAATHMTQSKIYLWDAAELSPGQHRADDWYSFFRRGILRLQLAQHTQARMDLNAAAARGGSDPYVFANLGWAHFREGNAGAAAKELNHAVGLASQDGAIRLLRQVVAEAASPAEAARLNDPQEVVWMAIEPPHDHVWLFRPASLPQENGDWAWADHKLSELLAAQGEAATARLYLARGLARAAQRRFDDAEKDFRQATEMAPSELLAWQGLARVLMEQNKFKEALQPCGKALELNPGKWQLWYLRACSHRFHKEYEPALADLNKAMELMPDLWILAVDRAFVQALTDDFISARAALNQLLDNLAPDADTPRYEATSNLTRIADAVSQSEGDQRVKAHEYYAVAAVHYRKLCARTKNGNHYRRLATCLQDQGNALREQKQFAAAADVLTESLWAIDQANRHLSSRDPTKELISIIRDLSSAYQDVDRFQDAIDITRRRIEIRSRQRTDDDDVTSRADLADSYGSLAWLLLFERRPREAEAAAREGLSVDASQTWIRTNLAHALLFQDKYDEARTIYEQFKNVRLNEKQIFREAVVEDFQIFRNKKLEHPDMAKIERLLEPKTLPESVR